MTRYVAILAVLVFAIGCGKKDKAPKSTEAPAAAEATRAAGPPSALWQLAPKDAVFGIVVADGAQVRLRRALIEVERILRVRPAGVPLADRLHHVFAKVLVEPENPKSLESIGVDVTRGLAGFVAASGEAYAVLTVTDRAAFRRAMDGSSETVDGRELDRIDDFVCAPLGKRYACAATPARLAEMATAGAELSPLAAKVAALPAELRGEIEAIADLDQVPGLKEGVSKVTTGAHVAAAAVKLGPGGATLRARLSGKPTPMLAVLAAPPSKLSVAALDSQPAGLLRLGFSMAAAAQAAGPALAQPIAPGLTVRDVLESLTGELVVHAPSAADPLVAIELGLRSPAPFAKLIDMACAKLPAALPALAVTGKDGKCAGTIDFAALARMAPPEAVIPSLDSPPVPISIAVQPDRLRIEFRSPTPKPSATLPTSPIGLELARDPWSIALWGQALYYDLPENAAGLYQQVVTVARGEQPPWLEAIYFAMLHVYEIGYAVGARDDGLHLLFHVDTFAGDPDDVYQGFEKAVVQALDGDAAGARSALTALAKRAPDSRVGHQMTTRGGGGVVAVGAIGALAAVAIPAFIKYVRKSKSSEARTMLNRIRLGAEAYRAEHGAFPPSTPLTPADPTACCEKCAPDSALWQSETWTALHFSMDDPHFYTYQFANQGDHAIARAVGDLDCDGVTSIFELTISADGTPGDLRITNELE